MALDRTDRGAVPMVTAGRRADAGSNDAVGLAAASAHR